MTKQYDITYKPGQWAAICDVCGFKFKNVDLKRRWDGVMVCSEDWETRHPMDFIKAPNPQRKLPWARPEPTDTFVNVPYINSDVGTQENTVPPGTFNNDL